MNKDSLINKISSLYLHFPYCIHLCNYCDFYKNKLEDENQIKQFEELLTLQWHEHKRLLSNHKMSFGGLETLYFGGGTPSLWSLSGIDFIKKKLFKDISLANDYEFTLEVDPGTITEKELNKWLELGVNRFSVGVQAYNNKMLEVLDRRHRLNEIESCLKMLQSYDLNFSVDLLIGAPKSSDRNIVTELSSLDDLGASHFSVYILNARANYPLKKYLATDEKIQSEYLSVANFLKSKGYEHYEVSNFAKNQKYSKHNLRYWKYNSVSAVGPNATGLFAFKDRALRFQWKSLSAGYKTEEVLGESLLIEKLYMNLRYHGGLKPSELFSDTSAFEQLFNKWKNAGYLSDKAHVGHIILSSEGYLMCDSLMDDIFKAIDF